MVNSIIPSSPSQVEIRVDRFRRILPSTPATSKQTHQPNRRINRTDASTEQTHQPNRRINFVMKRKAEDERGKEKKKEKEEPNYGLQADALGHIRCQCYKTFLIYEFPYYASTLS